MRMKLVETEPDSWTIYRRVWFWWWPVAQRSGVFRAMAFMKEYRAAHPHCP